MSVSILTVDDETDITDLFRQHFRREVRQGVYVLHFACSADEALAKLADGIRPQLIVILSDINMPGMDGLTLLQEIKKLWLDIPVMIVTAYGDDERRRQARELVNSILRAPRWSGKGEKSCPIAWGRKS